MKRSIHRLELILLALLISRAGAIDLATRDGLTLRLDDRSGQLTALAVDARTLPLLPNVPGGFSCAEFHRATLDTPRTVAAIDFDKPDPDWVGVANMKVDPRAAAETHADGGADGTRAYARVGRTERYGHGIATRDPIPVEPGGLYDITWQARVPALSSTYIVYVRAIDARGREITGTAPPKGRWQYSPFTDTHYIHAVATGQARRWEPLRLSYRAPDDARHLRVAICLWRGQAADVDSVAIRQTGVAAWEQVDLAPAGPLETTGTRVRTRLVSTRHGIELATIHEVKEGWISITTEARDLHAPPRDRALEIRYTLPVNAKGWTWDDDIRTNRRIVPGAAYQNVFGCGSHAVSLYPFSCIRDARTGIAMATPMDQPRIERRQCSAAGGFETLFDIGLSPHTAKIGPGRASAAVAVFRTDPHWGFRSAAARYYEIFPQFFTKRARREGGWMFVVRPGEVPGLADFGMTFYEGTLTAENDLALARRLGMYILPYTEAWGLRQVFPDAQEESDLPPYEDRFAQLKQWAADATPGPTWNRGPRHEIAQAVLTSLPTLADGRAPFTVDKYGSWAHWWRTNPDPDLPAPNRATVCKRYDIDPHRARSQGVYLDSVSTWGDAYENTRETHLACTDAPPTFSVETGRPVLVGMISRCDFIDWLAGDLHRDDRLLHMNLFGGAHRFHAHQADVLGSEVGSAGRRRRLHEVEPDAVSNLRRTYAYRKPVANLLQEGNYHEPVPPITHADVARYIKHQAFYGFYPSISTGGGESHPGYRGWKRYFRSPELFERDRSLFKIYMPIIRRINSAGWEPVTHARTGDPAVFIERFGSWTASDLHFTLRNSSGEQRQVAASIDLASLGAGDSDCTALAATELVSNATLDVRPADPANGPTLRLALPAYDTAIVHVHRRAAPAGNIEQK